MRVICSGQSGLNKQGYLEKVIQFCEAKGKKVNLYNIGDLMYGLDKKIPKGKILNLPYHELDKLCNLSYEEVLKESTKDSNCIINAHSTFRWCYGLFRAYDINIAKELKPDMFVTIIDNVYTIKDVLSKREDKFSKSFTLKDIMVWREEEITVSDIYAESCSSPDHLVPHFIVPKNSGPFIVYQLMFERQMKKIYSSFPISLVKNKRSIIKEIGNFKSLLKKYFIVFDPRTIDEKRVLDFIKSQIKSSNGGKIDTLLKSIRKREIEDIKNDIDGQIISRDFKLIEQSDFIIAYIPVDKEMPLISSGVERELEHGFRRGKEIFIICKEFKRLSPFDTRTATEIFPSFEKALTYFKERGFIIKR